MMRFLVLESACSRKHNFEIRISFIFMNILFSLIFSKFFTQNSMVQKGEIEIQNSTLC